MSNLVQELKEKVLAGNEVTKDEALTLYNLPEEDLNELCKAAVAGERERALEINARLMPLHKALFVVVEDIMA